MTSSRSDVRWRDAIWLTVSLWAFTVVVYLPVLLSRHEGQGVLSVVLDAWTIIPSMGLGLLLFACFRGTVDWPNRWRTTALILALILVVITQIALDMAYITWITQNLEQSWNKLIHQSGGIGEKAFRYLLVYAVNLALFQITYARKSTMRSERQLTEARSAAQQAQLQALRYQLNPHFLFNTLNSISSLIVTRRNEDAEQMTSKLSSFLRSSLTCDPAGLVPLEEELALIEEYLDIEAVRFGERLDVHIELEPEAGAVLIPSFLVQPLVENAIKHGVAPSRDPVVIKISAALEDGQLCISVDNGCVPHEEGFRAGGAGVGLMNVRQRLSAVFGERASLTTTKRENGFTATICIPGVKARG
jgi:sensor histidine kinase YesM